MSVDDVAREIADGLNCPDFVERPANTCLDCVATIAAILTRHFGEQDSLRAEVERLRMACERGLEGIEYALQGATLEDAARRAKATEAKRDFDSSAAEAWEQVESAKEFITNALAKGATG